jgi:hypothetical protein
LPQFLCREPGSRCLASQFVKSIGKVREQRFVKDVDYVRRWRIQLLMPLNKVRSLSTLS